DRDRDQDGDGGGGGGGGNEGGEGDGGDRDGEDQSVGAVRELMSLLSDGLEGALSSSLLRVLGADTERLAEAAIMQLVGAEGADLFSASTPSSSSPDSSPSGEMGQGGGQGAGRRRHRRSRASTAAHANSQGTKGTHSQVHGKSRKLPLPFMRRDSVGLGGGGAWQEMSGCFVLRPQHLLGKRG
ncbi:hypothetical protein B484DRAFT_408875, partial [Ochromonadaceae sp. CCMP2298]